MKTKQLFQIAEKNGWVRVRSTKHHIYKHPSGKMLAIPKTVKEYMGKVLIRQLTKV